jgi:hypothetical protein
MGWFKSGKDGLSKRHEETLWFYMGISVLPQTIRKKNVKEDNEREH